MKSLNKDEAKWLDDKWNDFYYYFSKKIEDQCTPKIKSVYLQKDWKKLSLR